MAAGVSKPPSSYLKFSAHGRACMAVTRVTRLCAAAVCAPAACRAADRVACCTRSPMCRLLRVSVCRRVRKSVRKAASPIRVTPHGPSIVSVCLFSACCLASCTMPGQYGESFRRLASDATSTVGEFEQRASTLWVKQRMKGLEPQS